MHRLMNDDVTERERERERRHFNVCLMGELQGFRSNSSERMPDTARFLGRQGSSEVHAFDVAST